MPRRNLKFSFKPCVIGMSALALVIAPVSLDFTDFPVKLSTAIAKGGGGGGNGGGNGGGGNGGGGGAGGGAGGGDSGSGAGAF